MATQKVAGTPLDVWIDQHEPIQGKIAADWLRQLIESADALHKEGFVHQDIKPSNIIYSANEHRLVLVDLGAVRYMDASQSMNLEIQQGLEYYPVIGTPGYHATEQAAGRPNVTSDYYSIGRTLIHLLTGVHTADLPSESNGRLSWRKRAQVSVPLADLIDRLAEPNQLYRPASATAIFEYLADLDSRGSHALVANAKGKALWRTSQAAAFGLALGLPLIWGISSALSTFQGRTDASKLLSSANQLLYTGASKQAVPLLEQAIQLDPQDANIRATLAFAHFLLGDVSAAIETYKLALELSPDNFFIHYNLANVYERVDVTQAIAHYQIAAQARSPVREDAINNLARLYIAPLSLPHLRTVSEYWP